jgi:hypothetical protein
MVRPELTMKWSSDLWLRVKSNDSYNGLFRLET